MQFLNNPNISTWPAIFSRPANVLADLESILKPIQSRIIEEKDGAIRFYNQKFDNNNNPDFQVSNAEIIQAASQISPQLKQAIDTAYTNIYAFHLPQLITEKPVETMPGVVCRRKSVGIERVGLYIPGGSAPLFSSVLMLGVPARIAGCKHIVLCSPADASGQLHPALVYAASLCGIDQIYKVGGSQAIFAMANGTQTIPKVYKIFGPGNAYVMAAKQMVSVSGVAIDMPAGPSEVLVVADNGASPDAVAADMLAQAEHGPDSQAILLTDSAELASQVQHQIIQLSAKLPRLEFINKSLENSKIIVFDDLVTCMNASNIYAPEHLILSVENPDQLENYIVNAGSVFMGYNSPESVGDYASGTNHCLPTYGYARAYSGVSVDSFVKKITFQQLSAAGLSGIGPSVMLMARAEGLDAHSLAVEVRLTKNQQSDNPASK